MRRAAIFDLDGTLVDSAPSITYALNRLRAQRGLPMLGVQHVRNWVSLGAPALVGHALDCSNDADAEDVASFRTIYNQNVGTPDDLYPGIADALLTLRQAGIVLGVCTNKPQALSEKVLVATGIAGHFTAIIGGDAVLRAKPDGDHLLQTLEAMGCSGLPFDFIGDSRIDLEAAQASGARFLWAAWGYADKAEMDQGDRTLHTGYDVTAAILGTARP